MCDNSKLIKLINDVKMFNGCNNVELIGSAESFDELRQNGFSLKNFKYTEVPCDDPTIMIIPEVKK